jgi:hypothetical protein
VGAGCLDSAPVAVLSSCAQRRAVFRVGLVNAGTLCPGCEEGGNNNWGGGAST